MLGRVYELLYSLGYAEPLHPVVVHIPIGILTGALVLGVLSFCFHRPMMGRAARYVLIISFVSLFPAVLFGFMDWQHFFAAGWLFQIKMKLALACVLLVSTFIAMIAGRGSDQTSGRACAALYVLPAYCRGSRLLRRAARVRGQGPSGPAGAEGGGVVILKQLQWLSPLRRQHR